MQDFFHQQYMYLEPNWPLFWGVDTFHFSGKIFQNMGHLCICKWSLPLINVHSKYVKSYNTKNIFRHLAVLSLNSIPSPLRKKICMHLQPSISIISVHFFPIPPTFGHASAPWEASKSSSMAPKTGGPVEGLEVVILPVRSVQTSSKTKPTLSRNDLKIVICFSHCSWLQSFA